jgi:hypothetical protein
VKDAVNDHSVRSLRAMESFAGVVLPRGEERAHRLAGSRNLARGRSVANVRLAGRSGLSAAGHHAKEGRNGRHFAGSPLPARGFVESATIAEDRVGSAKKAGLVERGVRVRDVPSPAIDSAKSRVDFARTAGHVRSGQFGNGKNLGHRNSSIRLRSASPES